jgi:ABC-2 type transport system permease protein
MLDALWAELMKVRRSRLPLISVLAFTIAAGVGGLFMFILANPARARALGLLGAKAKLLNGAADWPTYLGFLAQTVAVGGTMIFGLIVIWIFGREFSDHTVKDLLALPTSRTTVVAAKFAVTGAWCLLLAVYTYVLGLGRRHGARAARLVRWYRRARAGRPAGHRSDDGTADHPARLGRIRRPRLPRRGRGHVRHGLHRADRRRARLGQYFPYSVPALYSGIAGADQPTPGVLGYMLVAAVGMAGVIATAAWWRNADQSR